MAAVNNESIDRLYLSDSDSDLSDSDSEFRGFDSPNDSDSEFLGFDSPNARSGIVNVPVKARIEMLVPDRDESSESDVNRGWMSLSTESDEPPFIAPFMGAAALNSDSIMTTDGSPIHFFNLLFDEEMWTLMTSETNKFAHRKMSETTLKPRSRLQKWQDVSVDEMKVFLALAIAMGLVMKTDIDRYKASHPAF